MLISYKNGQTSVILRVKILDSTATTGAGKTGLTNASSGLIISTIADTESAATVYTAAASHVQTIATLGTYAAPSASNCRFQEVDATNHPGVYEIQLADARFAVSNAKSLLVSISGPTGAAQTDVVIPLTSFDPYDAVRAGLTALPNANAAAANGLLTSGTGANQIDVDSSGRVNIGKALGTAVTLDSNNVLNVSTKYLAGTALTGRDIGASVLLSSGTGTGQLDFTSGVVKANATQWLGGTIPAVNVTGVPLVDVKYFLGTLSAGAAGYAGIDWGHINAPTTTVNLSGTTVSAVSGAVGSVASGGITNASFAADTAYSIRSNTAQSGSTSTTLKLDTGASATDNFYNGTKVSITSGAGVGQCRLIQSYVGATKVATVNEAWVTTPDNTSVFNIQPFCSVDIGMILGTVISTPATAGILDVNLKNIANAVVDSTTAQIGVNVVKIKGTSSVGAAGYVGIDWASVNSASSTVNLSGTTVNLVNTATNLTNAATNGDLTATMKASVTTAATAATPTVAAVTAPVTVGTVNASASSIKKNTALAKFQFVMKDATTHTPKTGLTVAAARGLDGAAFASCANSVTELSNGWYYIDLAAADLNGNVVALKFTASGADDCDITIITQP